MLIHELSLVLFGPVAQTGRAPALQAGGPGFKSRWVHLLCCICCGGVLCFIGAAYVLEDVGEVMNGHFFVVGLIIVYMYYLV